MMDPHAAWLLFNDSSADSGDRLTAIEDLIEWIDKGGFVPKSVEGEDLPALRQELVLRWAEDNGIECFWHDAEDHEEGDCWADSDGEPLPSGWYYWSCQPGCLPDSDPMGGYATDEELVDALAEEIY